MSMLVKDANGTNVAIPGYDPCYRAGQIGLVPVASCTDLVTITGSASGVVRVKSIKLGGVATSAGSIRVELIKRSTAGTGGTSTAPVAVPLDSASPAAGAILAAYTANPTVGTIIGPIGAQRIGLGVTLVGPVVWNQGWDFSTRLDQPIVLRGVAQQLAINLGGVTVPSGGVVDWEIEWEEGSA